jgi:DNA-binding SARP family transcriptional activator
MGSHDDECVFRILGPIRVEAAAGPVTFVRRQHQDLLALLLLRADHVTSVAHIVDAMWGEQAPRTAGAQIKNMVSGLRSALADGPHPLATVDWQPAGYRLRILRGQLDLAAFTSLVSQARTALPGQAVPLLREAIGLWRSRQALAGVRANFADDARMYLEERRTDALEALFAAELACSRHTQIIAELTEAVAQHPTREGLVAQLMTALYRSGRTSDALDAYQRARRVLVDAYGLEPGQRLKDMERRILRADPVLDAPPHAVAAEPDGGPRTVPVPAQLPLDTRNFTGRVRELAALDRFAADPPAEARARATVITVLMGSAGVGKTSLAIRWAHSAAHRFPDGQLYVNLCGFDADAPPMNPSEALRFFLEALAVPPHRVPLALHAQAALFRSLTAASRMLIVLDNAVSTEQVRPLLPAGPGSMVVVTSRKRLTSLLVAEGAHPVTVDLLTDAEARDLLVARLGAARVRDDEEAAETIAARCARLPLALAVVAARAAIQPTFPLAAVAAQLTQASPLGVLASDDPAADVRAAFSWSYARLGPQASCLFRWLGLHPGPETTVPAAASLLGRSVGVVRPLLSELVDAHLIFEVRPGRFGVHDLLRAYAMELCDETDPPRIRAAAVGRMLDHYLYTGDAAAGRLHPHRYRIPLPPMDPAVTAEAIDDREQALAWFARERGNLVAAVEQADAADLAGHAWRLAATIGIFVERQGRWDDWIDALSTALSTAERSRDAVGQAHAHSGLGLARSRMRQYDGAYEHLGRALALFETLDDGRGLAFTHLRMSAVCDGLGRPGDSLVHARRAYDLFTAEGFDAGRAQALNTIGWYLAELGDARQAVAFCEDSVTLHRGLGDRQGAAHALDSLGYVYHRLGEYARAAAYYEESAQALRETGDRSHEAFALAHLGDARQASGDDADARRAWTDALRIFDDLRHPEVDRLAVKLRTSQNTGP